MKIFIISHDLSHNCLGRAVLLAGVFGRHHDVEVVGPCFGPDIWFPCRDWGIKYRKIDGEIFLPQFTSLYSRLIDKLKGDLVLAVKPRPTSYGVALMHRALTNRPVLLDIDDDEMALYENEDWKNWDRKVLLRRPNSPLYTSLLESMTSQADAITVASKTLQSRYGGEYLTHVKDPDFLDPARYDKRAERQKRDLPLDEKLIVFAGSPREHKGLELLLNAIERLDRNDVKLVVVGATNEPDNSTETSLRDLGGERLYLLKQAPMRDLPSILATADLIVLPQRDTAAARSQMPSKLFDAMSMALPIVATAVSDIPEVLAQDCGLVVAAENAAALSDSIAEVLESPELAQRIGQNARRKLISEYSIESVQPSIERLLGKILYRETNRAAT